MNATISLSCPTCSESIQPDDRFCESCGTSLSAVSLTSPMISATCQKCTSSDLDLDGFCNHCGHRNPTNRDHFEQVISSDFAAVSDRGIKHSRNEDSFAIEALPDGSQILVVCDGVSSSSDPGSASQLAAQTACQALVNAPNRLSDPQQALKDAIAQASAAVTQLGQAIVQGEPPSTTIVAAIAKPITPSELQSQSQPSAIDLYLAWVGDSRGYWLSDDTTGKNLVLTQDHSWMNEVVAAGEMTFAEAEASPHAHAITRWLGSDSQVESGTNHDEPSVSQFTVTTPGKLLLCSDGLWNYAPAPDRLRAVLTDSGGHSKEAATLAADYLKFALDRGGQDNITIALKQFL